MKINEARSGFSAQKIVNSGFSIQRLGDYRYKSSWAQNHDSQLRSPSPLSVLSELEISFVKISFPSWLLRCQSTMSRAQVANRPSSS